MNKNGPMTSNTIQSLQKQLGHINLLLDEAKKEEKAAVLASIKEQVQQYGITELELLRPKRVPAKYYDPSSGKSWSGRGACPKWLIGKNRDDYLIREAAKPWWPGED